MRAFCCFKISTNFNMEQSNLTIKKTYDKFEQQDFKYGAEGSDNLNPKREISFDQLDIITQRLQEVTDDIIRKRITPSVTLEEAIRGSAGGESFPQGISFKRQSSVAMTGGRGNALVFPAIAPGLNPNSIELILEQIVMLQPIPSLLDDLDTPFQLDCDEILKIYGLSSNGSGGPGAGLGGSGLGGRGTGSGAGGGSGDGSDDSSSDSNGGSGTNGDGSGGSYEGYDDAGSGDDGSGGDGGEEDDSGGDDEEEVYSEELEECEKINMEWLKIILILLKILKILKIIIDLVLSIIVPIIDIVMLAVGCWINPPNIAVIIQRIVEMVVGLIVMILAQILQMIWDLLNLDCLSDMTMDLISQIQEAMAMMSELAAAFNPNTIVLGALESATQALSPLDKLMESMAAKKEAWSDLKKNYSEQWDSIDFKKIFEDAGRQVVSGVAGAHSDKIGKLADIKRQAEKLFAEDFGKMIGDINKNMIGAGEQTVWGNVQKSASGGVAAMMASPQFVNISKSKKRMGWTK